MSGSFAPTHVAAVLLFATEIEMIGIHTIHIVAVMQDIQVFWAFPFVDVPRHAMGVLTPICYGHAGSVRRTDDNPDPFPAAGYIVKFPLAIEALAQISTVGLRAAKLLRWIAPATIPTRVMVSAPSASQRWLPAPFDVACIHEAQLYGNALAYA